MQQKTAILLLSVLLTGCSPSLVYSPSLNLPNQPLKLSEVDLQGGIELLPEARPDVLEGRHTTAGLSGQIAFGLGQQFNMSLKGWLDVEKRLNNTRAGFSLQTQFVKPTGPKSRFLLMPKIGLAYDGIGIGGYGIGNSLIYQKEAGLNVSWYIGTGLLWGFKSLQRAITNNGEAKLQGGIGLLGNLGYGWQITKELRVNGELNTIYQINTFEEARHFLISPTIGLGYIIRSQPGQ